RLQDVVLFAEVLYGAEKTLCVLNECDEYTKRDHSRHNLQVDQRGPGKFDIQARYGNATDYVDATNPYSDGNCRSRKDFNHRIVNRMRHDCVFERVHVLRVDLRKFRERTLFPVEQLKHHDPADMFLEIRVNAGDCHPY